MTEIQRPRLVLVKWRDCETLDGWHDVPTLLEIASLPRIIWTVGFLIEKNEERIVLSSSWETTFGKIAGGWIIPMSQVLSIDKVSVEESVAVPEGWQVLSPEDYVGAEDIYLEKGEGCAGNLDSYQRLEDIVSANSLAAVNITVAQVKERFPSIIHILRMKNRD